MKIDIIYTFDAAPQQRNSLPFVASILNDKKEFFKFITTDLNKQERETLVKISTFIWFDNDGDDFARIEPVEWWDESKGKFWDDEIPALMQEIWGVTCTYEPINK